MNQYFITTKSPLYSAVAVLPLLVIYEILLALTTNTNWQVRNAADVWLRQLLSLFSMSSKHLTFMMIGFALIAIGLSYRQNFHWQGRYFLWMFMETAVYAFLFSWPIHFLLQNIFFSITLLPSQFLQDVALSIGAGLFEELVFRVILLNALFYPFLWSLKKVTPAAICAILSASFLFSLSHYIGVLANDFSLYTFLFRWIAGLLFTALYYFRGFAITVYTHALYDIWLLF